jgi:hypothetical protein
MCHVVYIDMIMYVEVEAAKKCTQAEYRVCVIVSMRLYMHGHRYTSRSALPQGTFCMHAVVFLVISYIILLVHFTSSRSTCSE